MELTTKESYTKYKNSTKEIVVLNSTRQEDSLRKKA